MITSFENDRHIYDDGLGMGHEMQAEYTRLKADWNNGHREREATLHLLFLAWMHWADPRFVTGMTQDKDDVQLWKAIFDHFGGEAASDAEFLHVAALMAGLFPWALGDDEVWVTCADRMAARAHALKPEGFSPEFFEGRHDYGNYFAQQWRGWSACAEFL